MSESAYPKSFESVVGLLKEFPGVGSRTAERMTLALISWPEAKIRRLGEAIASLPDAVSFCPACGNISESDRLCAVCSSPSRDRSTICVVEDFSQIRNIEAGGFYKGLYHVLGGKLSPLSGVDADDLNLDGLLERVGEDQVSEVILALSLDVEGRATVAYILGLLAPMKVKTTRPASGLPAGSDFSFADSATIAAAIEGRTPLANQ